MLLALFPLLATTTPLGHVALVEHDAVITYEIRSTGLTALSTTPVDDDVRQIAWGSPSRPVVVMGAYTTGLVDEDGYRELPDRGTGDLLWLDVDARGTVWAVRCLRWGDECDELRWYQVGGKRVRKTAPAPPRRFAAAPAPTSLSLITHPARVGGDTFHTLRCADPAGPVTLVEGTAEIIAPPTWRWLSTEPPLALVELFPAPIPEPFTYLVGAGCTIGEVRVELGPGGLWAEATDDGYLLHHRGRALGRVTGQLLTFAPTVSR
jgi:hypothetical protein